MDITITSVTDKDGSPSGHWAVDVLVQGEEGDLCRVRGYVTTMYLDALWGRVGVDLKEAKANQDPF